MIKDWRLREKSIPEFRWLGRGASHVVSVALVSNQQDQLAAGDEIKMIMINIIKIIG